MIHLTAEIKTKDIGDATTIWQYTVVLEGAHIGSGTNICSHCFIESDVWIGNDVTVKSGVQIWDGCHIENNVFIGPNVTFTNDLFPRSKKYPSEYTKTRVLAGASIGANATILAGVTIGQFAMVGAGSVVTKDVPPYTICYGNPARVKAYICQCGNQTPSVVCPDCAIKKNV